MSIFSGWGKSSDTKGVVALGDIESARERIRASLPITPLTHSPSLSESLGREVYFKWDNKLKTGSFKERGASNFLSLLSSAEKSRGVCAASAGNHALALSYHCSRGDIPCHIVMPLHAPLVKVEATKRNGADVILEGNTFDEAYAAAEELAKKRNYIFVPGFDDPRIVAGQGTAGLEIMEQLEDLDSIVVPVGGGGLISGIALAIKSKRPEITVVGVQSEWASQARDGTPSSPLIPPVSIADGIAVKKIGAINAPLIAAHVDEMVTVNERQIAKGIISFLEVERTVIEGAGAAGLAALLEGLVPKKCKRVVVMACGSNIDVNILSRLIEREMGERGRLLRVSISVPDRPGSLRALAGIVADNGANVLQIYHERSFSSVPGNVEITFLAEVRNSEHKSVILRAIREAGLEAQEL